MDTVEHIPGETTHDFAYTTMVQDWVEFFRDSDLPMDFSVITRLIDLHAVLFTREVRSSGMEWNPVEGTFRNVLDDTCTMDPDLAEYWWSQAFTTVWEDFTGDV